MTSFAEYTKKKKKQNIAGGSFEDYTRSLLGDDYIEADIAPVRTTVGKTDKKDDKKDKDDSKLDFFQKGAFDDGYQFGDVAKSILGTAGDAGIGILKGGASIGEGIVDAGKYAVAGVADALGNDDYAEKVRKKAQKNSVEDFFKGTDEYLDQYSVLGRTSDAVMQGIGQVGSIILTGGVAGALGAGAVGATVATSGLMGLSSAGSGMSEAYEGGATDKEATIYGISKGVIDAGSELLFGGLGKAVKAVGLSKGLSNLDDVFAQKLSSKLSNQVAKNFAEYGVKASAEGFEEVIAGLGSAVAKKFTYMDDKELGELVKDENLLEQFVVGTVTSGMIQSGYIPATKEGSLKEANETGKDFITGYTQNEQSVIDKEIENRIAKKETDGKKLTNKEKTAIEEEVKKDLDKGYISIDTIESTLGGETYNKYKSLTEQEETLTKQLEELEKAPNTVGNAKQYEETQKQLEELKNKDEKTQIKEQLSKEVKEMTLTDRLSESYNEKSRRSQAFEADLTKYDAKQQEVIKKAVESGILNNTNRTHEFVDMVAKISADKGVSFDFTNNAKLKETGFALEGKTVNGYVKDGNIAVNIDSSKALNTVVGHEITHVLEGTELYTELQNVVKEFATKKGEYQTRYEALKELYKDVDGAVIENELTADLVGEYLFTDSDFVSRLSVEKPNIFQKIYEEIKYLAKLVTGSKEARELEKVKRAFDKAYKESSKTDKNTVYSVEITNDGTEYVKAEKNLFLKEDGTLQSEREIFNSLVGKTFSFPDGEFKIVNRLPDKDMYNELSRRRPRYEGVDDIKKLNSDVNRNMEELLTNSELKVSNEADVNNRHEKQGISSFDTRVVKFYDGTNAYDVEFSIATLKTGEKVAYAKKFFGYDGELTKKIQASEARSESPLNRNPVTNSVTQNPENASGKSPVKYSLSVDNEGNSVNENVQRWAKSTKAVDENGNLKVLHHGTATGEFTVFDKQKASPEGDWGAGFYLTDNEGDVEINYEDGGPDFENKVARLAERIEMDEDVDYETAEEMAREQLYKGSYKINAYVKIENPAIVGETYILDGSDVDEVLLEDYDGDTYAYYEDQIAELMENVAYETDLYSDSGEVANILYEAIYEGGIEVQDLKNRLNELYLEDSDGNFIANEVARSILENLGYDGIIDNTVSEKFSNMGLDADTTHYIVFKPNQIKNISNQNPTDNPDINLSLGEQSAKTGDYRVYGKDIALEAPVAENSTIEENSTVQQENSDYSEESWSNLLDVAETDPIRESEEMTEAPVDETQVLYSLEEQQQQKIAEVDGVVESEETADTPELTVNESYNAKLGNYRTALEGYKTAKTTIETAFDEAINKKTAEYNALKRKDTQKATTLLTQIENLKLRKNNNVTNIDSKITRVESTINNMVQNEAQWKQKKLASRRVDYHKGIVDNFKNVFKSKGFDFDKVLEKAKNKGTFASVDNTPQRFIEKTLGYKAGQILNDLTVNKVAQNESKAIKWLNSYTDKKSGLLAQISKEYGIKPRSKESASAQMYAEGFWVDDDGNFIKYGDAELAQDYPNAKVRENIKRLAKDPRIRKIYDETLDMINASRTRNLYPEIPRRNNYFLHFREMDDTFSKLGIPFNPNDIRLKDLPTDINGMTADLKPGQPYFASAMHRMGYKTTYDLVGGVERYLNSAKNQIYHIDDIQTLRALRNYIADTYGQAKGLESLDSMTEEEAVARIEEVYNSHLSTFAKFLNEEANVLAGKTSLTDRGLEGVIGRRGIQFLDTVNRQVGSNMVGGNISSALTNTVSMVQAVAKSNKFDATKAFAQTVTNKLGSIIGKTDGFVENNPMMIRRKGIEKLTKTPWESITDKGYLLMSAIDNVSSEFIARTKFNELTRKGMSEQQAHIEADKWASRILGDRSLGQQPQLYNSKMLGLVTKFQLEVRNQLDSQFYDTIQEAKLSNEQIENRLIKNMKTSAKVGSTLFQLAVLQHMFGQAFESVAGYNPAFDIIEAISQAFGWDDDEESEDTVLDNLEEGFLTLLGDLPYTSTFTGGRIPISSALPIEQFVTGKDSYGNEKSRWETIKETAPYYLAPTGYGQFKKTKQGLEMFGEEHPVAGSYTDSGNLRFPIEDTPANRVKSAIFGQYASEEARDYFDNERSPLKEKQIQEYKDLDIPIKDYWEYREGLSKHDKLADKADYIASLDLPVEKKNIMINNIADRKEAIDMTNYDDFSDFEEFDYASKNPEKYEFLQANNISYKDYSASKESKELYNWYYDNPENVPIAKVVSGEFVDYRYHYKAVNNLESDKDENGNSISGSKKAKVLDYINNLDIDYGQRIIFYRSLYDSKSDKETYNADIVEYLNNRDDVSYEEMVTILESLDMVIDADGTVYW